MKNIKKKQVGSIREFGTQGCFTSVSSPGECWRILSESRREGAFQILVEVNRNLWNTGNDHVMKILWAQSWSKESTTSTTKMGPKISSFKKGTNHLANRHYNTQFHHSSQETFSWYMVVTTHVFFFAAHKGTHLTNLHRAAVLPGAQAHQLRWQILPVMAVQKMTNVTPLYGKRDPYYS